MLPEKLLPQRNRFSCRSRRVHMRIAAARCGLFAAGCSASVVASSHAKYMRTCRHLREFLRSFENADRGGDDAEQDSAFLHGALLVAVFGRAGE